MGTLQERVYSRQTGLTKLSVRRSGVPLGGAAAYAARGRAKILENKIGTLETGKKADIAIWDRNLYEVPTDQIKNLKCLMTLVNGESQWRSRLYGAELARHVGRALTLPGAFDAAPAAVTLLVAGIGVQVFVNKAGEPF